MTRKYYPRFRFKISLFYLITILVLLISMPCHADMQSSSYKISQPVMSSGGIVMQSASYINQSTLGQPTPIGTADLNNYVNNGGFWHSVTTMINNYPKALSWLMLLLGD